MKWRSHIAGGSDMSSECLIAVVAVNVEAEAYASFADAKGATVVLIAEDGTQIEGLFHTGECRIDDRWR